MKIVISLTILLLPFFSLAKSKRSPSSINESTDNRYENVPKIVFFSNTEENCNKKLQKAKKRLSGSKAFIIETVSCKAFKSIASQEEIYRAFIYFIY